MATVVSKSVTFRGAICQIEASYCARGVPRQSKANVPPHVYARYHAGDEIRIRILPEQPEEWIPAEL